MIRKRSIKFQISAKKDARGTAETRSAEWKDGRNDGRTHGRTPTRTDECHFYNPPPPTSGDNNRTDN